MAFKNAYSIDLVPGRETVFVLADDNHRKVRLELTEVSENGNEVTVMGYSRGSSYTGIKAAKADETQIIVKGTFTRNGEDLLGDLIVV